MLQNSNSISLPEFCYFNLFYVNLCVRVHVCVPTEVRRWPFDALQLELQAAVSFKIWCGYG